LSRHLFEVECRIEDPDASQRLQMPSWIPGSYLLREFARHVVSFEAMSGDRKVPVEQIDHSTWCCRGAEATLTVRIKVFALDESVRGAFLDTRRAYFNGPCLFLLPLGRENEAVELEIEPPRHAAAADWRVATGMTPVDVDGDGFGTYGAADYDELLDHPFEISDFESVEFEAAGVPHRLVVAGRFESDLERVAQDLRQLCETEIEFFGAPAPFERYCFLGLAVGDGYGGLEHRASSSLIFGRDDLPRPGETGVPSEYQRFLALASHEYFHTWHVKRTKPAAFMPYRLDRRNHTRLLWVFEGMTSYYQELLLLRSGLVSRQVFLQRLGELLTRVYRTPGRFMQTLADSSFNAWDVLYKPEPNNANSSISYYTKGAVAALALDLTLRAGSSGKSLDDVVRGLWTRYGSKNVGVPEDGLEALAVEIGGRELEGFFERTIRGTDDPPLAELLAQLGVTLELRASTGLDDRGGTPRSGNGTPRSGTGGQSGSGNGAPPLWLGAAHRAKDQGIELTAVFAEGPAERAGLEPGDVLIALDRLKVGDRNLKRRLARFEPGERVTATFFRGDELIEAGLVVQPAPNDTCWVQVDERAGRAAAERRKAWLGQ
jgi:predicted metalloprotease with PDZ domain